VYETRNEILCREEALIDDFPRTIDIDSDNYQATFESHKGKRLSTS